MQIVFIAWNVKSCFLDNKKITNLSSAELAQIVVIQKLRVRYPQAPSVVSLSKTVYYRNLVHVLVSTQEGSA